MNLQVIFDNLKVFAQEGTTFVYLASMITGLVLALFSLRDIVNKGKGSGGYGQEKSWGSIAGRLILASCLITLANKLDMLIATTGTMEPARQALSYAQGVGGGAGAGPLAFVWAAISAWCVLIGTAGFMRGFLLLDKASQGQQDSGDAFWRGLWHVVGGAICVNLFL